MKPITRVLRMALTLTMVGFASGAQAPSPGGVGITRVVITERQANFGGAPVGNAGPYELLNGKAYGELDPKTPENAGIVNLDKAPLNAKGHVDYASDITILKPVDVAKGNGLLLCIITNRGNRRGMVDLNNDIGLQFLLKHGYTVFWHGWDGNLPPSPEFARGYFPIAFHDGKPLAGSSRDEFTDLSAGPEFTERLTYPAATLDQSAAWLTVREHDRDPRKPMAASSWSYVDANHVKISAAPGFDRGAIYEFIYPATNPVVMGVAFAATRDLASFFRYADQDSTGTPNPVRQQGAPFKATIALGASLSGRFLKDFVYQGFNSDGAGRIVFDGLLASTSGSRKTYTNYEFAQPGRFSRQHEDHLAPGDQFPFSYATTTDPISGKTDGLLAACSKSNTCPRMMQADTDTEFWQARGSLVVTDTSAHALQIPSNVRVYMFSGFPHITGTAMTRGQCQQYQNALTFSPYERALLVALGRWVTEGAEPPASRYPNLKDGTLVTVARAQKLYPKIPGALFSPVMNELQVVNPNSTPPAASGPNYPLLVPLTNADGNPLGGIEPPEITVPVATYSGRNVRAAGFAEGDLCNLFGSYIPFAMTRQERLASGDSRLSIEERYKGQQDYANKRKQAVDGLVQQGLILPEDAEALASGTLPSAASTGK